MADFLEKDGVAKQLFSKKETLSDEYTRYEQIGNVIYMLAQPSVDHEAIVAEVFGQLWNYLGDKPCKVFGSNIGLDLKEFVPLIKKLPSFQSYFKKKIEKGKEESVYLLPDVSVLCGIDKTKFSPHGYKGVPRMLIEISSPATADKDFYEKKDIYEAIGIGEYWIISDSQNVTVFVLENGKFVKTKYQTEDDILEIPVSVFPGLVIRFDKNKIELP